MSQEILRVQITDDEDTLAYAADVLLSRVAEYKVKLLSEAVTWSSVHLHADSYGGFTDWHQIGKYQVVVCRSCKLRVKIPAEVRTVQQLIDWAERGEGI